MSSSAPAPSVRPGPAFRYTQPLYGWFLIVVYWFTGERWWSLGVIQTLIAVATALVVLEIGRAFLPLRYAVVAALIATLQPYLIWHDVHGNREILDQLIGALLFLVALRLAKRPSLGRRSSSAPSAAPRSSPTLASSCSPSRSGSSCSGGAPAGSQRSRCRCSPAS